MTIKHLLIGGLLAAPALSFARPAIQQPITYTNPDGTKMEVRLHGDEHFNYFTDVDNTRILERSSNGQLVQAVRSGRILTTSESDIKLLRSEQVPVTPVALGQDFRMAALDNSGRTTYPTSGDIPALVILLEYADVPFSSTDPRQQFDDLCNKEGYSDYGGVGSARDYYISSSNGEFRPQFNVYGPVKLQHEAAWYVGYDDPTLPGYGKNARFGVAIQEAVKALDSQIDFSEYDLDKDGAIDNIFFFYSGHGQADTGDTTTVWPHQSTFERYTNIFSNSIGLDPLFADGVQMKTYACANELNGPLSRNDAPYIDGIGGFVHEYGHVLGLPDLYDTSDRPTCKTPGYFDVMDQGSYNNNSTRPPLFSAYEKWVCNWLEYTDAEAGESYTLPSLSKGEEAKAVRIRIRQPGGTVRYYNEYYVLETRTPEGWDTSLGEYGMMIWHINYSKDVWTSNSVNTGYRPNVEYIAPDETSGINTWPGAFNEYTFLIPTMDQALKPYNTNSTFAVWLSNISYDEEKGESSFEYNKYTELPDVVTVLHDNPTANQVSRNVTLRWDAVPEAVGYQLTVKYKNAAGKETVYGGFDEALTDTNNYFTLRDIPLSIWNQEFTAHVRVVTHYPSSAVSNTITFIPSQLSDGSGVESIENDETVVIYGSYGSIVAPEGAKVYNLSGVETGTENIPNGIYIVNYNGKTVKVVVK